MWIVQRIEKKKTNLHFIETDHFRQSAIIDVLKIYISCTFRWQRCCQLYPSAIH